MFFSIVPTNWAVCTGFPEPPLSADETPFDCAKFYLSLTGSDYDRANVLRRRDVDESVAEHAPNTVARNELEHCILDWVHHTIAYDLRFGTSTGGDGLMFSQKENVVAVQPSTVNRATQATKDALQRWSGDLVDDQDNPLGTFDDDEDLRHLSFVRMVRECCSFESAHSSTAALTLLMIGNGSMVIYVVLISSWTQRRSIWHAALGFVAWVVVFSNLMPRFSLPISQ